MKICHINKKDRFEVWLLNEIKFVIYGEPKGKGRPRVALRKFKNKDGNVQTYSKAYTPDETVSYENLVRIEYGVQTNNYAFPADKSLEMEIYAYFSIPKSTSKKKRQEMLNENIMPNKKPDVDNIIKIIADSLNKVAYGDDTQITDIIARKRYSENPRVEIIIREIEEKEGNENVKQKEVSTKV